jgi:alanine racemase
VHIGIAPESNRDTARAWLEVDLAALVRNASTLQQRAGVPLLPMVKADAYGLGAVPVARALESLDPWGFGVATVDEGAALRAADIRRPILVVTPLLRDDLAAARAAGLTPSLHRCADIAAWRDAGGGPWHLAIDTGMSRAGVRWDAVAELVEAVRRCPPEGAFTHFHSADRNDGSVETQERRFLDAVAALPSAPPLLHAENSAALERCVGTLWTVARPGVFLYGVGSDADADAEPVVALRARVVDVRDLRDGETVSYGGGYRAVGPRRIATAAVGYGDGYRRSLSNVGTALVGGRRVPVAGLVTMDMTMLDVTDVDCAVGDVATFLGGDRDERLTVAGVARTGDLSPYELLTGLRLRVPHLYRSEAP